VKQFIRDLLNPTGPVSFGRFMSLITTAFVLGWDSSYIVYAWHLNHHLPAGFAPVDVLPNAGTLLAQGGFMTLFYGVTKYGDIKNPQPPNP
jgi:hypothetical protein